MEPLKYRLNPCDIARFRVLAPIGDLVARLSVECPCCNGFRILFAFVLGLLIGAIP